MRMLLVGLLFTTLMLPIAARSQWQGLGSGVDHQVLCLVEYDGQLYVGGRFSNAGGNAAIRIARWNDSAWSTFGATLSGDVLDLIVFDGDMYACGSFGSAGSESVGGIAKWDGVSWSALGNQPFSGGSTCLAVYNNELYVGGFLGVFKWNGTNWSNVGIGFSSSVNALAVHEGELYATGGFVSPFRGIAKFNGINWSAVGNSDSGGGVEGFPKALTSYNGNLYVGGLLFSVDGIAVNGIAKWDGMAWSSVGGGLNNDVTTFHLADGVLYVGGFFTRAGENDEIVLPHVGIWDGSSWSRVQHIVGLNSWVFALSKYNGCLYAGGNFNGYGPNAAMFNQVAKYCLPLEISEDFTSELCTIQPNPTNGQLTIDLGATHTNVRVIVRDALGREVTSITNYQGRQFTLDVEGAPGIYFLDIRSEDKSAKIKLVKE